MDGRIRRGGQDLECQAPIGSPPVSLPFARLQGSTRSPNPHCASSLQQLSLFFATPRPADPSQLQTLFPSHSLEETPTTAPSVEPRDLLSFWRSQSANKGRSLVPRSRQSRSNKSRPRSRSRSRSRSSHRLTRHFHCQQQTNKQKSPLSAHPRILSCLRGVAVSHAASILTAPPRRQDRAALFRASCRGPPEQQQRWGLLRRRYGDSPSSPAPSR